MQVYFRNTLQKQTQHVRLSAQRYVKNSTNHELTSVWPFDDIHVGPFQIETITKA